MNDPVEVTAENFPDYVRDILGIRIVCLRLSDVERLEQFIASLRDEGKLSFVEGPARKKTFVLRVDPRDQADEGIDLQYSDYSSTHYLVTLGTAAGAPQHLLSLRAELQVRTILEEAWGEIDHKYRYEVVRGGVVVPEHVERGFYSFAAYLQAAALHAEYICAAAEAEIEAAPSTDLGEADLAVPPVVAPPLRPIPNAMLRPLINEFFHFNPNARTLSYVSRRLLMHGIGADEFPKVSEVLLTEEVLHLFHDVYSEFYVPLPFLDVGRRNVDLINIVNFALIRATQGDSVAIPGLRAVLQRRAESEEPYEIMLDGEEQKERWLFSRPMAAGHQFVIDEVAYEVVEVTASDLAQGKLICVRVVSGGREDGSEGD